ncbi:MAG: hypothetical protein RhofKO_07450 [Rhodothermales bacterium]
MSTVFSILAMVAVPILFFMLTWVLVTAYRLLKPEEPLPYEYDAAFLRQQASQAGYSMPVGVREIREDQRHARRMTYQQEYEYHGTPTALLPEAWREDLWRRRN